MYEQYLKNPKDFRLLFAYSGYKAAKEKQTMESARKEGNRGRR